MILNKRMVLLVAVVLIFVFVAGIIYFMSLQTDISNTTTIPQIKEGQIGVNLLQLNNSGESGTAILSEKGGYVTVTLNVVGGKDGTTQPSHIHTGTCPGIGGIKYSLKDVVNGGSTTVLNVTMAQLKQQLPLAVNVHESTENFKNYVACGEIFLP